MRKHFILDIRNRYTKYNYAPIGANSLRSHESLSPCESAHVVSRLQSNATLIRVPWFASRDTVAKGYRREQRSAFPGVFAREKSCRFLGKISASVSAYAPRVAKAITRVSRAAYLRHLRSASNNFR